MTTAEKKAVTSPLIARKLQRKAAAVERAKEQLEAEIRLASAEGWSLRQIAAQVGMSHVQVNRLIAGKP